MIKTVTKLFGIDDVRIYPINTDNEQEYTCKKGVKIAGCKQISLTYMIDEKPKNYQSGWLDVPIEIKSVSFVLEDTILSPAQEQQINNRFCQIKLQIKNCTDSYVGDVHFVIYKSSVFVNGRMVLGNSTYTIHKFQEENKNKIVDIKLHDNLTPLKPTESR